MRLIILLMAILAVALLLPKNKKDYSHISKDQRALVHFAESGGF